jgi:hypothetical protein
LTAFGPSHELKTWGRVKGFRVLDSVRAVPRVEDLGEGKYAFITIEIWDSNIH